MVPQAYTTIRPIAMLKNSLKIFLLFDKLLLKSLSAKNPHTKASGINPHIYPPVRPANAPIPPVIDEKTGSPHIPIRVYVIIDNAPFLLPNTAPAVETANVCSVNTIGVKKRGIVIKAHMHITAVNKPHKI